jgi:hypothetical protein
MEDLQKIFNSLPPIGIKDTVSYKDEKTFKNISFIANHYIEGIKIYKEHFIVEDLTEPNRYKLIALNEDINVLLKTRNIQFKYTVDRITDIMMTSRPSKNSINVDSIYKYFEVLQGGDFSTSFDEEDTSVLKFFHPSAYAGINPTFFTAKKDQILIKDALRNKSLIRRAVEDMLVYSYSMDNSMMEYYLTKNKNIDIPFFVSPFIIKSVLKGEIKSGKDIVYDPYCYYSSTFLATAAMNTPFIGVATSELQSEITSLTEVLKTKGSFKATLILPKKDTEPQKGKIMVSCLTSNRIDKDVFVRLAKKGAKKYIFFTSRPLSKNHMNLLGYKFREDQAGKVYISIID